MGDAGRVEGTLSLKDIQKKVSAGASYRKMIAAKEAGKPICVAGAGVPNEVMHAMEVHAIFPESLAAVAAGIGKAGPFFDAARDRGYTNTVCSYTRCGLGISWTNQSAFGPIPEPDLFITDVSFCCLHLNWWTYLEDHFKKPTYYVDMPPTDNPDDPVYIDYYENQLLGMVNFIEANTKCRFNQQRVDDAVKYSDLAGHYWKKIMDLRRNRPSPMSFRNLAGQILPLVTALGDKDTSDFYEALYHSHVEDVKEGKTPCKDGEKHRLIWNGIPIWHHLQIINYFEDKGANFVWEPYTSLNWGNKDKARLDLSRPFRALAEKYTNILHNRPIESRFKYFDQAIKDYGVDGLVMFSNRSCRTMTIGQQELVDLVRERHGIPVLIFEGDQADPEGFGWDDARTRIDGFIEVLEARKKR
ncbi:MAG: 2-hydroxyacyl-CoA dehydratase [Deltaproteobacteria bacterium]|nr:2-hydroxyacyl-CoA dehydratase [Deltaproteobacteria bacterium]